jgi:hypothetical protein
MSGNSIRYALALGALLFALSCDLSATTGLSLSSAHARVGRPLTPMSYAGVARRTTYRGAAYGAAAVGTTAAVAAGTAAAAGAAAASAPVTCHQVVNAYGQILYQCP